MQKSQVFVFIDNYYIMDIIYYKSKSRGEKRVMFTCKQRRFPYSMKKKLPVKFIIILLCVFLFSLTPPAVYIRSLAVMSVYSYQMKKESIMDCAGFDIHIPGGMATGKTDWYPFVMTFVDNEGFQGYMKNENLSLTILYNFPAFSLMHGCSRLFDEASPYYNSFYGAYLVSDSSKKPFGFYSDGSIREEELVSVPEFDFYWLVLEDFGLSEEDFVFDCRITGIEQEIAFSGREDWTRIDADITVSGACHTGKEEVTSYLQYGRPAYNTAADFSPVEMKGRIYARYFPEWNTSIFYYIMTGSEEVLEECDREILSLSQLR